MADPAPTIRTVIIDDEPLAIERMQRLCAAHDVLVLAGTAHDGYSALRLVDTIAPDLLLLDIAMPDIDGLAVARAANMAAARAGRPAPAVIFVSAHDSFAVEAFDISAIDYLLKPVSPERFARAIAKLGAPMPVPGAAPTTATGYALEFWIPHRSELVRVAATDIERIDAERDYMRIKVGDRTYLLHQTISALEDRLDPALFLRIHRSVIVRRDRITGLAHDKAGGWHVQLGNGDTHRVGRTYLSRVKAMAGR